MEAATQAQGPVDWAADEILRFYRAFNKYGSEFDKVSKMVGGGKSRDKCEALWRRHQAYLSLDKRFQSEVAFVAMVQDSATKAVEESQDVGGAELSEDEPQVTADNGPANGEGGSDDGELSADSARVPPSLSKKRPKEEDVEEGDGSDEAGAAAAVVAMASPGGAATDGGLAATRARRTPKRPPTHRSPGGRTPQSTGKRGRATRDEDIYEYYDEAMTSITESARKRRAAASKRLDFEPTYQPVPTRRREMAEEARGIDALLALAEAGEDGEEAAVVEEVASEQPQEEEEEEEDEEGQGEEVENDDDDEDYMTTARGARGRRTPNATPAKGRSRPGSAHATPRRSAVRAGASPGGLRGIGSPGWLGGLGSDADFMGDLQGDVSYLTSPGLPGQLAAGFIPSPHNPMPRLRRRKHPPEGPPTLLSPIKSLFGRRSSLGGTSSLLASGILGFGGTEDQGGHPMTAAEARLRHCLNASVRRWAMCEHFYSAVDRAWFMNDSLSQLATHLGLPPDARLTRKEWSVLRSAMGRPRRLSWRYLREERAGLEQWRANVREHFKAGSGEAAEGGLVASSSMPRALSVGQRVIARHPSTHQLHDGSILTAAHDSYRVQFDRRELGVERVKDTEVMPTEPWENLPTALMARRPRMVLNGRLVLDGRAVSVPSLASVRTAGQGLHADGMGVRLPTRVIVPDPHAMSELAANLDKKEALLVQLRQMNDEAQSGLHMDPATGAPVAAFAQAYAQVVLKLKEINEAVQAKLLDLERGPADADMVPPPPGSTLPPELAAMGSAITAQALAASALSEARQVVDSCRRKVGEAAAEVVEGVAKAEPDAGSGAAGPIAASTGIDWASEEGRLLGGVIEGAVWSLVLLQQGADKLVPAGALAAALDNCLLRVKPKAPSNQDLYVEIEEAMNALKLQLLASS